MKTDFMKYKNIIGFILNIVVISFFAYIATINSYNLSKNEIILQANGIPENLSAGSILFIFESIYIIISSYLGMKEKLDKFELLAYTYITPVIIVIIMYLIKDFYMIKNDIHNGLIATYLYFAIISLLYIIYSIVVFIKNKPNPRP